MPASLLSHPLLTLPAAATAALLMPLVLQLALYNVKVMLLHPPLALSELHCLLLLLLLLQLASYKVKVMLAEPKTKRQRPEQLVPGLFGPGGALGHLPPLGLDAASEYKDRTIVCYGSLYAWWLLGWILSRASP
jgi:hypothetical protein